MGDSDAKVGRGGPGEEIELRVEGVTSDGRGLGRVDGLVWMVSRALPGDVVRAVPVRRHKRFVEASVVARETDAPERRTPPCVHQADCPGCPWMVVPETVQAGWKRQRVRDALGRIGGLDVAVGDVVSSPVSLGYRNRIEWTLGRDREGRPEIGYVAADTGRRPAIVGIGGCGLLADAARPTIEAARRVFLECGPGSSWDAWDAWDVRGGVRLAAHTGSSGDVVLALRGPRVRGPAPEEILVRHREELPNALGVVRIESARGGRGGAARRVVAGSGTLEERLGGTCFEVPVGAFVQVNASAGEALYARVLDDAAPHAGRAAVDLYGGIGVHGWGLSASGARVIVVEADAEAVACGRAATRAGVAAPRFVRGDVARWLRGVRPRVDVVVANPPRTGLGDGVVDGIVRTGARRIVYVSCDPGTFARDAASIVGAGYELDRVTPFDLFPQTPHVEVCARFSRGA